MDTKYPSPPVHATFHGQPDSASDHISDWQHQSMSLHELLMSPPSAGDLLHESHVIDNDKIQMMTMNIKRMMLTRRPNHVHTEETPAFSALTEYREATLAIQNTRSIIVC